MYLIKALEKGLSEGNIYIVGGIVGLVLLFGIGLGFLLKNKIKKTKKLKKKKTIELNE